MGNTMIFPGNASVTEHISTKHNFESGNFTLHCWMSTTGSGPLFTQPATGLSVVVNPAGSIQFTVKYGDQLQTVKSELNGLNDGNWQHIAAVRSGDVLSIFVNGKKTRTVQQWIAVESAGSDGSEQLFPGDMGPIGIWEHALNAGEVRKTFLDSPQLNTKGLLGLVTSKLSALTSLSAEITLSNTTAQVLKKKPSRSGNIFEKQFPETIAADSRIVIKVTNAGEIWKAIECAVTYENGLGSIEIDLLKTRNQYNSNITAAVKENLIDELNITQNTPITLQATLVVAENLVLAMMKNFYHFLDSVSTKLKRDQIKTAGGNLYDVVDYNKACQIFNLYFELKPLAIIYCESTEDVQFVYKQAIENNLPVRVRSGGHDHEGECMGTDTIVLDMTRIDHVTLERPKGSNGKVYAHIGPGIRFISLTTILAQNDVMIPHGTCATVGIAGFTMGGGWGPWTRKEGMCCERLAGATIVLGDGSVRKLEATDKEVPELLWALRGGGGMSYGIVTELVIETFPLPAELIKFEVEWNPYTVKKQLLMLASEHKTPTIQVLDAWEKIILSKETQKLIGTNLKVSAKNLGETEKFDPQTVNHNCIMYGYWEGNEKTLEDFLKYHFKSVPGYELRIDGEGGDRSEYGRHLMSKWDRESYVNVKRMLAGMNGKPLPPDLDAPAPHKITSRFANREGLGKDGHAALLQSLTSPLISTENRTLGLFSYITLGAISGNYYQNLPESKKDQSAFPYKDKQYTIQYQTWWNETLAEKEEWQNNQVYVHVNRALDWMQKCRDFKIPNTSGAFISFKDSSIPTSTYFDKNYDRLMKIKKQYSEDPMNHFRTRKTIL